MSVSAPDLRARPPRRWNVAVDGVIWLPRMADKARAHNAGTLGMYLYGQSPIDDAFLRAARLDYPTFLDIVREARDDAEVLAGIEGHSPGATPRLLRFSENLPRKAGLILSFIDYDDGYAVPGWARFAVPVGKGVAALIALALRARGPIRPAKRDARQPPAG
jgi:hypothetical protein